LAKNRQKEWWWWRSTKCSVFGCRPKNFSDPSFLHMHVSEGMSPCTRVCQNKAACDLRHCTYVHLVCIYKYNICSKQLSYNVQTFVVNSWRILLQAFVVNSCLILLLT
jgi:hypothetical protein